MRVKLTVCYDGTELCGWQVQKNGVSVQELLEEAVFAVTGEKARVTGSGRTDAGVHAAGQTAHFDTESSVPAEKFGKAMNAFLPPSVRVIKSERAAEGFHACNSAKKKTYRYSLYLSETENPLKERYAVREDEGLDVQKMRAAAAEFIGTHDFAAYKASGSAAKTTVRTIYSLTVEKLGEDIEITVCGNGFLYNMVRIIAGVLVCAGKGKIGAEDIKKSLTTGLRPENVKTLPAKGLCLLCAEYD